MSALRSPPPPPVQQPFLASSFPWRLTLIFIVRVSKILFLSLPPRIWVQFHQLDWSFVKQKWKISQDCPADRNIVHMLICICLAVDNIIMLHINSKPWHSWWFRCVFLSIFRLRHVLLTHSLLFSTRTFALGRNGWRLQSSIRSAKQPTCTPWTAWHTPMLSFLGRSKGKTMACVFGNFNFLSVDSG